MAEKSRDGRKYQLYIHFRPWRATLESLDPLEETECRAEQFGSPLELLERLEQDVPPVKGLK